MSQQLKYIAMGKKAHEAREKMKILDLRKRGVLPPLLPSHSDSPLPCAPKFLRLRVLENYDPNQETPFLQKYSPFQERPHHRASVLYRVRNPRSTPNVEVFGPERDGALKASQAFKGEDVPGYLSQMNLQTLMEARQQSVQEIRDLTEKLKVAKEELFDLDFHIDLRVGGDFLPLGLNLLAPEDVPTLSGPELNVGYKFRSIEERERFCTRGKELVDGKICSMADSLMVVNNAVQASANYRAIAIVNFLLDLLKPKVAKMVKVARTNPNPFPPPHTSWWLEEDSFGRVFIPEPPTSKAKGCPESGPQ